MVDQRLKDLRGASRRDFLRWSATAAACLGLERARFLNVLNDTAGTAAADTSACNTTNNVVSVSAGNGSLANETLTFPYPATITGTNPQFSHYALGKGVKATGYDKDFYYGPDSPWQTGEWKMTAFVAGSNETHTNTPTTAATLGANQMLASMAAIQQKHPTLLPVLRVGGANFGVAPGAPAVATVPTAAALVDLFNSAASRALLNTPETGALNEAYYKAFLSMNAAAGRSTVAKQYQTGKVAANLLARNLSLQLTPTTADDQLFGITATTPAGITGMARSMITAVRAMSLGLTSMIIIDHLRDDPHGLFAGGDAAAMAKTQALGKMWNGLFQLAKSKADPSCSSKTLAGSMVVTIHGDTAKQTFNRNGWGDGTTGNHNLLYVMGAGYLKTGWQGSVTQAGVQGWDPQTAALMAYNQAQTGQDAAAAALYAVAKGDINRVRDFGTFRLGDGVINPNVIG